MKEFLLFESFVAHTLVKIFFYLGAALTLLAYAGATLATMFTEGFGAGIGVGFVGLFGVVFYLIMLRVSAEIMIVIFQIHDELKELNGKTPAGQPDGGISAGRNASKQRKSSGQPAGVPQA